MGCDPQVDMFRLAALYVVERLREQLLAHISDMLRAACAAKVCFAYAPSQPVLVPCEGYENTTVDHVPQPGSIIAASS